MPQYFALEETVYLAGSADLAIIVERKHGNAEWQARRITDNLKGIPVPAKAWKYLLGLSAQNKRTFYDFIGDRAENHSKYAPNLKNRTEKNGIRDLFGRSEDSAAPSHTNDRQNPNRFLPGVKVFVTCERSLYSVLSTED